MERFGVDPRRTQSNTLSTAVRPLRLHRARAQRFLRAERSGTVQEECCLVQRDDPRRNERPETIECGSNMLSGADPENQYSAA